MAQVSPILLASPQIQTQGTLYILAGINIIAFLFILLVVPETKVYYRLVLGAATLFSYVHRG